MSKQFKTAMAGDWFATTGFASTEFAFDKRFPDSGLDKTFRSLYKSTSVGKYVEIAH